MTRLPFRESSPQSSGLQPGLRWSHRAGRGWGEGRRGDVEKRPQVLPCTLSDSPWTWLGQQLNIFASQFLLNKGRGAWQFRGACQVPDG